MSESTHIPIIKLFDTLIVSIQVALSDRIIMQLKDDIGEAIQRYGPRGLIIDVSGVDIMDSYISRAIRDIGLMSHLMGVRAVICGLDPDIAMTLVEMGMDLEGVETFLHMEAAFEAVHRESEDTIDDVLDEEFEA
jgi:rsbT antagonist protein RsbS